MEQPESAISPSILTELVREQLPFMNLFDYDVVKLNKEETIIRLSCDERTLRPGGTVAGPIMMTLADVTFYGIVLANIGEVALAVTTNLSINFLRKPAPGDLFCRATILKLGQRLAVCECSIWSESLGETKPVAHVTGTYSIPPR